MFKKVVENFICEHCGAEVKGNGFTNHCPKCLWCKHVDINPGDRKESCGGLMEPVQIISEREGESIVHKCVICKKEKKNHVSKEDDFDSILSVAKKYADKFSSR